MNPVIHQDPVTIDKGSSFPGKQFPCLPVFVTSKTREEDLIRKIADDPKDGEYAIDLLIIAKYYERIADHAVNIAKWVIFSVTGVHKEE